MNLRLYIDDLQEKFKKLSTYDVLFEHFNEKAQKVISMVGSGVYYSDYNKGYIKVTAPHLIKKKRDISVHTLRDEYINILTNFTDREIFDVIAEAEFKELDDSISMYETRDGAINRLWDFSVKRGLVYVLLKYIRELKEEQSDGWDNRKLNSWIKTTS